MSRDYITKFRVYAQSLGFSDAEIDHAIRDVDRVMQQFVDASWGLAPVQLARGQMALSNSGTQSEHGNLEGDTQQEGNTATAELLAEKDWSL